MPGLIKKLYSPPMFDALFALAGSLGVAGLVLDVGRYYPAIEPASQPIVKSGILIAAIIAAALLAVASTRFDQKHADDFLFHTLTKSAFIAMFTVFFTLVLWELLFADGHGGLSSYAIVGILVASWSVSWFYTRLRGTRA
jgi:hypothetical protein